MRTLTPCTITVERFSDNSVRLVITDLYGTQILSRTMLNEASGFDDEGNNEPTQDFGYLLLGVAEALLKNG